MTEEYKKYFDVQFKELANMMDKSVEKRETFFQQILIVASGILGILVALHSVPPVCLYIRLVFVFATFLLTLCILTSSIVLYDLAMVPEYKRRGFHRELGESLHQNKLMDNVFVDKKKRTSFCEKCSLISLTAGLILLVAYTAMIIF